MADGAPAVADFLGVASSLTGRRWRERAADPAVVAQLQRQFGLPQFLAQALASRDVTTDDAENFLNPTLKALFPDPSSFAGMDAAAELLVDALIGSRPMTVFADYDVDGAASAAQLVRWFRRMGVEVPVHIPDRMADGYGPTPAIFRQLWASGIEIVVTLDCGAAAEAALDAAEEVGLQVVVIDHHLMSAAPEGRRAVIVNPNRPDCRSGQGALAAAGVTFVLLAALNRESRRRGLFETRSEPDLRRWLDLAALGAICDVTQLKGFNRAIVSQGLKVMSAWANPGLVALMEAAKSPLAKATAYHAGFVLGPRINAGGRIGRSDLGARLLATDDADEARALADELDQLNASRRDIEQSILAAAIATLEHGTNFDPDAPALVVAGEDWHPGVIGIVAGRLRERYRKPVVVIGIDREADLGRGSGRSAAGVNLGRAVQSAQAEGLLIAGGGHAMAAGLTIRPESIPEFRAFLIAALASEATASDDSLAIDFLTSPEAADRVMLSELARLAPFGPGNPEPLLALAEVRCERPRAINGGHLRCTLLGARGGRLEAIAWRAGESALGRALSGGGVLNVAGRLRADDWKERSGVQLEIEDAADPRRLS